jgi:uncharacterized membrane protein
LPRVRQCGCYGATASAADLGRDENRDTRYAAISRPSHRRRCRIARYDSARGRQVCRLATARRRAARLHGGWGAWLFTALALAEFITGRLPRPPSRKVPIQFGARVVAGALSGVTVAATGVSLAAGVVGAIVGTLGGASLRARLAAFFREDRPSALSEDVIAILAVLLIVSVP